MSEALLTTINRIMNNGSDGCPTGPMCLGECALIEHVQGNRWSAEVFLWQDSTPITTVAGWFESNGCRDVYITQEMHSADGTRDGRENETGTRHLTISFLREVDDRPMIDRVRQAEGLRNQANDQLRRLAACTTKCFSRPGHAPSTLVLHTTFVIDRIADLCEQMHAALRNGIELNANALEKISISTGLAIDEARAYLEGLKALMQQDAEIHRMATDTAENSPF